MSLLTEQETWNTWIAKHRAAEKILNLRLRVIGIVALIVLIALGTVYLSKG